MKNHFNRFLTTAMAFLILLSSVGFRFVEHQCMMRGKTAMMVVQKDSDSCKEKVESMCCAAKKQKSSDKAFFKKTDCCKETQKFEKLDVAPSAISKLLGKAGDFSAAILNFVPSYSFISSEWSINFSGQNLRPDTFSSRFHGRSMLFFIQSFLI